MAREEQVKRLNILLNGWANYFSLGPVSKAYRRVTHHTRKRLRQWLCKKHQMQGESYTHFSDESMHQALGLVNLETRRRNFS